MYVIGHANKMFFNGDEDVGIDLQIGNARYILWGTEPEMLYGYHNSKKNRRFSSFSKDQQQTIAALRKLWL